MKLASFERLRRLGILGMNARNFILEQNPREFNALADDKSATKKLCHEHQIPVPETYGVIERHGDVERIGDLLGAKQEAVVKPAHGSGGRGILILARKPEGTYEASNGKLLSLCEIGHHVSSILSGLYSLGARPDQALIEQRIAVHPAFKTLSAAGTPDIRVLVYRHCPIMAMLRLPTRASSGRANLHQGAIGAGVDLETGTTRGGIRRNRKVLNHTDTGARLEGFTIPFWREVLDVATRLSRALQMVYVGIDVVLDGEGPKILEANAHPGLGIQIANREGLLGKIGEIENPF